MQIHKPHLLIDVNLHKDTYFTVNISYISRGFHVHDFSLPVSYMYIYSII